MYADYTPKDLTRFWNKVDVSDHPKGCWLWTAGKTTAGYGLIWWVIRHEYAHRVSYLIANGECPVDLEVLHSCDNPACVNPKHLSVGTHTDNMTDCANKKRNSAGERHGVAKLTNSQVAKAKEMRDNGLLHREIAEIFGVSQTTITNAVNGVTYREVASIQLKVGSRLVLI